MTVHDNEVPCTHEWYLGACIHCERTATEIRRKNDTELALLKIDCEKLEDVFNKCAQSVTMIAATFPNASEYIGQMERELALLRRKVVAAEGMADALQLHEEAIQLTIRAHDHAKEAEGFGYINDPTGSGHVAESFRMATDKSLLADGKITAALAAWQEANK